MQDAKTSVKKRERRKRRLWPRWLNLRVVLVLLSVLAFAGWRYGWPARSWETTVCPLEEINWQEAVRLAPKCISPGSVSGARGVLLAEGSIDESGSPVFDLEQTWYIDPAIISSRREILSGLELPDLSGRWFRVGVFWVDMAAEHDGAAAGALDPAKAYSVLLMCPKSKRWEDAAELIVDLNRNRDLTDDPALPLSEVWSHEDENTRAELNWFVRVFAPITLLRADSDRVGDETLPTSVRAVPALKVTYHKGELDSYRLPGLAFYPTSFRTGQLTDDGATQTVVISPDRTRFGRFDGPALGCWSIDGGRVTRSPITAWNYERGAFWGCNVDADGRELHDGPYEGPTGAFCAETANGELLRIGRFTLWLRGNAPHMLTSSGWAPIPRFSSLTFPLDIHPLPVGDYGINRLSLVRGRNSTVVIETKNHFMKPSSPAFSINDGQTTRFRLPKTLKLEVLAAIEDRPRRYVTEWVWSSESDTPNDDTNEWMPQPGRKVALHARMSDPATGNEYAIYYRGSPPLGSLQLVINDASGNTVHQATMEYG